MSERHDMHFVEGLALLEAGLCGVIVIGRGHPLDLAAQMIVERDTCWRKLDGQRWPRPAGEGAR
ncbi:hypothetical protein G6N76_11095 [Rhizobium daejeonense]|uniref:Uncharacterized protein n=1 Tax=Rhizobium daejeonense TaxID=240521 RepID=A0A6M1RRD8_9HYPH|nr:hypothetical protein [Rhizobium daejeonense]NGO64224.1 hypothetical protein [Rhizobium daejeonense]